MLTKYCEMVKLPCLKWKVEAPASHQTYIVGWLMSQEILVSYSGLIEITRFLIKLGGNAYL